MTGKRGDAFSSGGISDEHKVDELLSGLLSLWDEAAAKDKDPIYKEASQGCLSLIAQARREEREVFAREIEVELYRGQPESTNPTILNGLLDEVLLRVERAKRNLTPKSEPLRNRTKAER